MQLRLLLVFLEMLPTREHLAAHIAHLDLPLGLIGHLQQIVVLLTLDQVVLHNLLLLLLALTHRLHDPVHNLVVVERLLHLALPLFLLYLLDLAAEVRVHHLVLLVLLDRHGGRVPADLLR